MTIIETERLFLRELTLDDAPSLAKVLCDADSMNYYPHPFSEQEVENWINWNINNYHKYNHGLWAVVTKEDNTFIGDCGITMQNIDGETLPEIGFHIINKYCNKGYATEAALASKQFAFEKMNYSKIYSYALLENLPSQRVSEKIGMIYFKKYRDESGVHLVQIAEKKQS